LIIWLSGSISNINFYNRYLVIFTVSELFRLKEIVCPLCGGPLGFHGCYSRGCKDEEGRYHKGWIVQGKCDECKKYPAIIPEFLKPYKHYMSNVIEAAISSAESANDLGNCAAENSTIQCWITEFEEKGPDAVANLQSILFKLYLINISVIELKSKSILNQLSHLIQIFKMSPIKGIISRANYLLTRYNSGFL